MDELELRRLWDAYNDPRHDFWGLVHVLGSIQKEYGFEWIGRVNDVMQAMELHDAGAFPSEWFDEFEQEEDGPDSGTAANPAPSLSAD
jgi:hypothetical protein